MAEKTYLQAISDGLRQEMRRDKRVFVIGEDVGVYGGAFKVTLGFQEEFGPWRVIDAPLSETAIVGGCTGAAIMGMRPVAEMQFADFVSCAWDHLVTVAAKQRYRAGTPVPIVVRLPSGGGFSGGPFHSQNPESSFAHIPGLKFVCPATPEDAKGLLVSAIEDPNPVLYFEHKHLYRRIKGEVPDERYTTPIGKARTHREGDDVSTVVTWGAMVYTADEAAKQLEGDGVSVEIVDLRTSILPWDKAAVLECVRKTSKVLVLHEDTRTGGFGAEIAATIAEEAFEDLDAPVQAHRRARHARAVLAAAREGVHPAGRGRRRRAQGARRVLGGERGHQAADRRSSCRRWASPSPRGRSRSGSSRRARPSPPTSRCSRSRPTRSTPRCRAPAGRRAQQILVQEGETVEVGTKLAVIAPEGAAARAAPRRAARARHAGRGRRGDGRAPRGGRGRRAPPPPAATSPRAPTRPRAEPAGPPETARRSSRPSSRGSPPEHGVDPSQVPGTGAGGRVTKKDILAFIESGAARRGGRRRPTTDPAPAAPSAGRPLRRPRRTRPPPRRSAAAGSGRPSPGRGRAGARRVVEPMTAMRRGIAEHMRRSLDTSAHVTSAIEVDMSRVVAIREKLKKEYQAAYGVNPTYLAFVARAAVETLRDYPWINGEIRGDKIVTRNYVNLGFAVELADGKGLIVPVVKNAEGLNLLGIARGVAEIAQRARDKKLTARRRPGRHVHDHEPGRLRHVPRHAGDQPAAGGDPRHVRGRQAAVGRAGRARPRRDRDPADHEPDAHVRPPAHRRRARRPLPARPAREARELGRVGVLSVDR